MRAMLANAVWVCECGFELRYMYRVDCGTVLHCLNPHCHLYGKQYLLPKVTLELAPERPLSDGVGDGAATTPKAHRPQEGLSDEGLYLDRRGR